MCFSAKNDRSQAVWRRAAVWNSRVSLCHTGAYGLHFSLAVHGPENAVELHDEVVLVGKASLVLVGDAKVPIFFGEDGDLHKVSRHVTPAHKTCPLCNGSRGVVDVAL